MREIDGVKCAGNKHLWAVLRSSQLRAVEEAAWSAGQGPTARWGGGLDQWHALALKKPFFFAFKKFSMDLNRKHAYINTFLF